MDDEEWPVDPDAVVVSDEPTEGLVTTPVDDDRTSDQPAPDESADATAASGTPPDDTGPDSTGPDSTGPDSTGPDSTGPDSTGPDLTGNVDNPAAVDIPAAIDPVDPVDPVDTVDVAVAAVGATANTHQRPRGRSSLVPVVVIVLISAIFGRTLLNQRDEARTSARTANHSLDEMREELAVLRASVADATDRHDDPFGDVFVDRKDEVRADVLDDVLRGQRSDLRTCVARQLTDAVRGSMPQIPLDDFDAQIAATAAWVAESRGLAFTSVPSVVRTDHATLAATVEPAASPDGALDNALWASLGAVAADDDIATISAELRRGAIAGQYEPSTNTVSIAVEDPAAPLGALELVTLAHELQHALTMQQLDNPVQTDLGDEARLAALALVEGDATLTMTRFEIGALDPLVLIGSMEGQAFRVTEELLADAPHVLGAAIRFPYTDGMSFACSLERDGGNAGLDAAYRAAPATTAQVMWPQRFHDAEGAVDVRAMPSPGERWVELRRGVIGALELRALFEAPGDHRDRALADAADRAAAWAGGEFAQWSRGDDEAVGIAFAEHGDHDGPSLCSSLTDWYEAAFANDKVELATDGLVALGADRVAVIRCANNTVRVGIGPDAETAAAITR